MLDNSMKKFQLGMVYLFALLAIFGIAPFIVLRSMQGSYLHALLDFAIVCVALSNAIYTYKRKEVTNWSLTIGSGFYTVGAVTVVYLNSPIFVFWIFPTVLANFFLLSARNALVVNLIAISCVLPVAFHLTSTIDTFGMISSLFMGSTMAYLFARLTEQQKTRLEAFAAQDPLTLLGNRRALDDELRICLEDYLRHKTPATLIVFDLDFFKAINDRFGHSAGDTVLINIGNLLLTRLRKTDRAFRFGGEEFVILARNTDLKEAALIAELIRVQIANGISTQEKPITASFGCASIQDGENNEQWFIRADQAMYQAKAEGRNRICLAETTATPA